MKKLQLIPALAFAISTGFVFAQEESAGNLAVNPVGIQVVSGGYDYDEQWKRYKLQPFSASLGTRVSVLVGLRSGGFVEFDDDASEIEKFTDDKGTDFLKKSDASTRMNRKGFGSFPKISDDGKYALIELRSYHTPAAGANLISASGVMVFKTATEKGTVTAENVSLAKDTEVDLKPFKFRITEAGKPKWGNVAKSVTFEAKQELDSIIEFKLSKADGSEIEVSSSGRSRSSFGSQVTATRTLNIEEDVDEVTIKLIYWTDLKSASFPFKFETDISASSRK